MAINFPDSPSVNDTHTVNGRTWVWDGTAWKLSGTVNNGINLEISDTAPATPIEGDLWYNSANGSTYTYYQSVWVELGNTAAVEAFIADADGDTYVHVEDNTDEDIIRLYTGGTERVNVSASAIAPASNEQYDLGTSSNRFRDLYLSGSSIDLGGVSITSDGTNLALPPISSVSGDFTVDTDTLHVDSTNNRVGIGTAAPSAPLEISTSVNTEALRLSANFTAGNQETYIAAVDTGDSSILAAIGLGSTGGTNDNDGAITFRTTTASSSSIPGTVMIINKDGNVGIGTTTPSTTLDLNGSIKATGNAEVDHINVGAGVGGGDLGEDIRVGGIRGALTSTNSSNQLIHLYNNVNIGYPSGWGAQDAPLYGLHVYGAITTSTHPMFVAFSNSTQEPTSVTQILYTGTTANRGNHYNAPNSRFTAPIAGVYQFHVRWWMHTGTSGTAYLYLYKNGSVFTEQRNNEPTTRTEYETISSVFTVTLAVNDYIEVYAYGSGGQFHSSTTVQYSEFSGYLLG